MGGSGVRRLMYNPLTATPAKTGRKLHVILYPHVRKLAPTSPRKFFLSPIVIKGFRKVKPIRICLLCICSGFRRTRENQFVTEKNIRFQTNMATRVVHPSIFQTFIFHYRNENTPFKTSKWKEKVLKKICLPLKCHLES